MRLVAILLWQKYARQRCQQLYQVGEQEEYHDHGELF